MRTVKQTVLIVAAAAVVLAAGCTSQTMEKNREEVRQRWTNSRAEIATKLAQGCYQRGEFGRASEHISALVRANEPYAPMYVLAARLAAEKGDLDAARAYAANATSIDPQFAEAHYVLGTIEQNLDHPEVAADEYEEAARLEPETARYILAQAEMLVWQQNTDEAVQVLRDASGRMPGRPDIYAALGDVLSVQNQYGEAAGCYRISLRLSPGQADVKEHLATALFYDGAYAEAEAALADLVPAGGETTSAWIGRMRADCMLALGRIEEARRLYRLDGDLRQRDAAPLVGLAKCDLLQNRLPAARQWLEKALSKNASDPEANALMGYILVSEGRSGEAAAHLELALHDSKLAGRAAVERLLAQARSGTVRPAAGTEKPSKAS